MRELVAAVPDPMAWATRRAWELALGGGEPTPWDDALSEPHALGWLYQALGEDARNASFARHTRDEAKHADATSTTQLFTPRWVADWLVASAAEVTQFATVLDPACGAGQMLLAAAVHMVDRGEEPAAVFGNLRGVDLDAGLVDVCRTNLKIAAARALGGRDIEVEAAIARNVRCGDGLFDPLEPADLVLANPPYMGSRSMPPELKERLRAEYPDAFHDLYLAFVARCAALSRGASGILAQQTLWYLRRFQALRARLLDEGTLARVLHLGHGVFDALQGEKATVMAWVWLSRAGRDARAPMVVDVRSARGGAAKREATLDAVPEVLDLESLSKLPGRPLAYWVAAPLLASFGDGPRVGDIADVPGRQNKTGRNAEFVRAVADVDPAELRRADFLHPDGPEDGRWVHYSKGGPYSPWWGNWEWVVDWSDEARAFYASNRTSNLLPREYWFREGLCYSDFGGRRFNARWMPRGCVFDMAGPAIFVEDDDPDVLAALLVVLNSTAARTILDALNPTLHFQVRDVRNLPVPFWSDEVVERLAGFGHELVRLAREGEDYAALEAQADRAVATLYGVDAGDAR